MNHCVSDKHESKKRIKNVKARVDEDHSQLDKGECDSSNDKSCVPDYHKDYSKNLLQARGMEIKMLL